MDETSICIVNQLGQVIFEGAVATEPEAIIATLCAHGPSAVRILFETGALSIWLWHSLNDAGLPVICIDARHAHKALAKRMNKSDRNDAKSLADIARMGWNRQIIVKSTDNQLLRALSVVKDIGTIWFAK
jgi:transposase